MVTTLKHCITMKAIIAIKTAIAACLAVAIPAAAQTDDVTQAICVLKGMEAGGDMAGAISTLANAATRDTNAMAMNALGIAYMKGIGVDADSTQATMWLERAGEAGYHDAYHNLGMMYKDGQCGLRQNFAKAARYFDAGARAGSVMCYYDMGDRLVFQYLIRRRTIMFSDIKSYTYPIRLKRQRNVAAHRIYLNTDEEIILHDTFTGLAKFATKWTQDKNDSNQSEVSSQYIHNGMAFSFTPHLLQQQAFYGMCIVLVAGIICIVRIVMNYSAPLPYFILALTPVWIYVLGMPFSSFNVADDTLTIRNRFVKAYNHNIYLDNVKWISMAGSSFHVMMKDGTSIKVLYNLTKSQKLALTKQFKEIGIACI